jgi:N-methylhydantoinase A
VERSVSSQARPRGAARVVVGVDVGGTFTDILALDAATGRVVFAHKLPSTREDPGVAAVDGLERFRAASSAEVSAVLHGTTVGTNALIQKRGARTVLVTTKGFRDVLELRRQARPRLYDLVPRVSPPLVPRELRIEAEERLAYDGEVVTPLEPKEIDRLAGELARLEAEAVAIVLLHAYAHDAHEKAIAEAVRRRAPGAFVSLSSEVCPEFREFERTSTTVVNAYIGPAVGRYVGKLERSLAERGVAQLAIVRSNGGLTAPANAVRFPAQLIESGPAAGIVAAAALGRRHGFGRVIAFDMGGTTAKAGVVIDGEPKLTSEFDADRFVDGRDVGGYPIKSPAIDVIEIGAGGGSIARVDVAGVVKVGPESAGAEPGPACYGRGGEEPTVTDAHVVLGHVDPAHFGDGDIRIDPGRARAAVGRLARRLGWTVERSAHAILRVATAAMAEMVRLATVRRGLDPRDFTLVAFGGAGPLHAAEIARDVGIPRVAVPEYPGLFSAIGATLSDLRHDVAQSVLRRASALGVADVEAAFERLHGRIAALIAAERAVGRPDEWSFERKADVRFEGQMFELTVELPKDRPADGAALEAAFRAQYLRAFGYNLERHSAEIVAFRLSARRPFVAFGWPEADALPQAVQGEGRSRMVAQADGELRAAAVWRRAELGVGASLRGPAIVEDVGATVLVQAGQTAQLHSSGLLVIEVGEDRA